MPTKNDITGDHIISRQLSDRGRDRLGDILEASRDKRRTRRLEELREIDEELQTCNKLRYTHTADHES